MALPDAVERSVETLTKGFNGNPLCLAAVLLSAMFALLTYFTLTQERQESHERTLRLLNLCIPDRNQTVPPSPLTIPDSYLRSEGVPNDPYLFRLGPRAGLDLMRDDRG